MMVMASFKKTYTNTLAPRTVIVSAPDSTADHCQHMPRPETPGKSQSSLAQSLVRSLLLFPGSLCTHKVLFVPSKSLFPQSCGSSIIKSHLLVAKTLPANEGDTRDVGSTPGSGRAAGEGDGKPLQYSRLGNPMDRGGWRATVQGSMKSRT